MSNYSMMSSRFLKAIIMMGVLCVYSKTQAQSFIGSQIDNRAGIQSVIFNPANVAGSKMGLDINILSGSGFVGSDYLNVNFSDIEKFKDGFYLETDVSTSPQDDNNFLETLTFLAPHFN
ncbi:hypothetical protein V8V91_20140 [Algoriphagus halophilus]|uniref:hypothetical protein n=1 Tax=Algoriphagus halophilus TaxID=226505 RepID=UPI00358F833E